jgi:DNA polymerase
MIRRPDASEAARLLRQRVELGERELFLVDLTREQALALARAGRTARAAGAAGASRPRSRPARAPEVATPPEVLPVLPATYVELRETALACTRCRLSETRTQVVFSDGVVNARLVVVGEAPGANEDATGLPFVGAAGKYLDLLLRSVGLSREESVYICNVLKCRPPGNRNPLPDEIAACSPFLEKQIELLAPEALLAVGSFAAQSLTGQEGAAMGRLRGDVHSYRGVPLVCTYHPAALLRNPKWTRAFWDDLQLLRNVMDGA